MSTRRPKLWFAAFGPPMSGADIAHLRKHLKLTQTQLAGLLGVHMITVSRWERGASEPPPYNQQQLEMLRGGVAGMDAPRFRQQVSLGQYVEALATGVMGGLHVQ